MLAQSSLDDGVGHTRAQALVQAANGVPIGLLLDLLGLKDDIHRTIGELWASAIDDGRGLGQITSARHGSGDQGR